MAKRISGSYRDPNGQVFVDNGRIIRTVNQCYADAYKKIKAEQIFEKAIAAGYLIGTQEISVSDVAGLDDNAAYLLEHESVPYVSYPYEWTFSSLKRAALHHLKFHLFLLKHGFSLSDATAYNIQFFGTKPVFIDALSIIPYTDESIWNGYQQFCAQFLNPLLLTAKKGIPFNSWYRGSLDGIPTSDLLRTLSLKDKLNWRIFTFLNLHARAERKVIAAANQTEGLRIDQQKQIPLKRLTAMLRQLHRWISTLSLMETDSVWHNYANKNTYDAEENAKKQSIVKEFVNKNKLETIFDIGCNSGAYSEASIMGNAKYVVGFDFDHQALEKAEQRSIDKDLNFLPIWLDASNPSPGQGWQHTERDSFISRKCADGILALAFEHHLAIGKNIPLEQVISWLVSLAPRGLIEFIPKSDPTVQVMLSRREDIFKEYNKEIFENLLSNHAKIEQTNIVSKTGRVLYEFSS